MSLHKIYSRYAKSLLEISEENGLLDSMIEDAIYFQKVAGVRDFKNLLRNPVIKPGIKIKIFDSIFKDKVNDIFYKFLILVVKKDREGMLPAIIDELLSQNKRKHKITDISLTTAVDMPKDFIVQLKKSLVKASVTDEKVDVTTKTDKSILGGFIIEVEDKLIDSSVRTKLKKIEKNIIEDTYTKII